jgi:hypothetical protein
MQDSQTISTSTSTQFVYVEPKIIIQPKEDWKTRYPKDLIPKSKKEATGKPRKRPKYIRKKRKQTDKKQNTKFIGLLQGVGGQRSRIKVKVNRLLYLKRLEPTPLYLP